MTCAYPVVLGKGQDQIIVGCGNCYGCLKQRSREWTIRLLYEAEENKALFLTLTYDENNYPDDAAVRKKELQDFFKRLRKYKNGRKIKYYAVGEYGEKKGRPHYHIILFGLDYNDFNCIGKVKGRFVYRDSAWKKGNIDIGSFEIRSAFYVTGYINKKINIDTGIEVPEKEFSLMSKSLGLGYAMKNMKKIMEEKHIRIDSVESTIPRYFLKKFKQYHEENNLLEEWELFEEELAEISLNKRIETMRKFDIEGMSRGFLTEDELNEYVKIVREKRNAQSIRRSHYKRDGF